MRKLLFLLVGMVVVASVSQAAGKHRAVVTTDYAGNLTFSVAPQYLWTSESKFDPDALHLKRNVNELGVDGRLGYPINESVSFEGAALYGFDSKLTKVSVGLRWKLF